jgi:hypothetical protein
MQIRIPNTALDDSLNSEVRDRSCLCKVSEQPERRMAVKSIRTYTKDRGRLLVCESCRTVTP